VGLIEGAVVGVVGVVVGVLVAAWLRARDRAIRQPVGPEPRLCARALAEIEETGRLDGEASVPNDITREPFPTPAMEETYLGGERVRAERDAAHLQGTRSLRVRVEVASAEVDQLAKAVAGGMDSAALSAAEKTLAAAKSALSTADSEHEARLEAIDAETGALIRRYWASNLRARERSEITTNIDTLEPPSPPEWRAMRAAAAAGRGMDGGLA